MENSVADSGAGFDGDAHKCFMNASKNDGSGWMSGYELLSGGQMEPIS